MGLPVEYGVHADARAPAPARPSQPVERYVERRPDGVWLVAQPVVADPVGVPSTEGRVPVRITGPGRKERAYVARIAELDRSLDGVSAELSTARLVERGSQRLIDRIEEDLGRQRDEVRTLRQGQSRLVLGMGALQSENEALRGENEALRRRVALLDAPAKRSWFARLLGR